MMHGLNRCAFALGFLTLSACGAQGELVHDDVAVDSVDTVEQEIIGGREATLNALPWMARITKDGRHHCGGVLVHPNWVLTAAHCVETSWLAERNHPAARLRVIMGDHHTDVHDGSEQERSFAQSDVIKHPAFERLSDMPYNDVALIRVSPPFAMNWSTATIGLPRSTPQVLATVAGWGDTVLGDSTVLRQSSVGITSDSWCNDAPLDRDVVSGEFCAGDSRSGSCEGDSGGPLFSFINGTNGPRATVLGTVSWGRTNCDTHQVYARIENYAQWIRDTIVQPLTGRARLRTPFRTAPGRIQLRCVSTREIQSASMSVQGIELSLDCPNSYVQAYVELSTGDVQLNRFYRIVNGVLTELPYATSWASSTLWTSPTALVEYGYSLTQ